MDGLRGLSLRSVAKAAGWTMGELNYRIGSKQQLIETFFRFERNQAHDMEKLWIDRLAAVPRLDAALLANIVLGFLDDVAMNHRDAALCWHEVVITAGVDETLRPLVAPWIDQREAFWRTLLAGRVAEPDTLAQVIADYVLAEQIYSVALTTEPWYRMIRAACLARLCGRTAGATGDEWNNLFLDLNLVTSAETSTTALSRQARGVARAAARLILEQGPAAITHRAVASALGQTASAVFHHFNALVDLVSAGFQSLYDDIQTDLVAAQAEGAAADQPSSPGSMRLSTSAAVRFVRAMHIIALAGIRDSNFLPLLARERAVRGRLIAAWFGEDAIRAGHYDRLALQVISMATGGRTLRLAAAGHPSAGNSSSVLAEIFPTIV